MVRRKSSKRSRQKHAHQESPQGSAEERTRSTRSSFDLEGGLSGSTPVSSPSPGPQQRSPESVLFEPQQIPLFACEKLSPEITPRLPRFKLTANFSDDERDEKQAAAVRRIDDEANSTERSLTNGASKSAEEEIHDTPTGADKCYAFERTLSISDELKRDMNDGSAVLTVESSSVVLRSSLRSGYDLPLGYASEPVNFVSRYVSDLEPRTFSNGADAFLDELRASPFEPAGVEDTGARNDVTPRNEHPSEHSSEAKLDGKRGDDLASSEESAKGEPSCRFAANWRECKRVLANLKQLPMLKMRGASHERGGRVSCARRYRKFKEGASFSSTSSSYCCSPSSWSSRGGSEARASGAACFLTGDNADERKNATGKENAVAKMRSRSTTPRRGSPAAKRCRATLRFDEEDETDDPTNRTVADRRTGAEFPPEAKGAEEKIFCPTSMVYAKTCWSNCTPESPTTSVLDLPVVSDSDGCSSNLQETERENATSYHSTLADTGVRYIFNIRRPRLYRAEFFKAPIVKVATLLIWLLKKLANVINKSYRSMRLKYVTSFTVPPKGSPQTLERLNRTIEKLHSENSRTITTVLEKVNRLSEELVQVRVSTEAALGQLTAEVNGMREASRKLAENNDILTQEVKRLHELLESIRARSVQAPPPPPPPPPPPRPPSPPSLPAATPSRPITPTTPNSGRTVKTPSRKCSTPLLNRPPITVEDLLKVTLRKAPQNAKENRRYSLPAPKGPVVSLDMLRSVKLKSARRRTSDQNAQKARWDES